MNENTKREELVEVSPDCEIPEGMVAEISSGKDEHDA